MLIVALQVMTPSMASPALATPRPAVATLASPSGIPLVALHGFRAVGDLVQETGSPLEATRFQPQRLANRATDTGVLTVNAADRKQVTTGGRDSSRAVDEEEDSSYPQGCDFSPIAWSLS